MLRIDSLETDLKQTKLTMGSAIVKLVQKVKKLEGILKRRNVVLSDSEEEEPEAQGRKREEQVEDISPNTLEAAKTLSRVTSLKPKSIDKGRRYKRRKETTRKKVVTSLDFQEEVDTGAKGVNTAEGVNTGSIKVSTVSEQVSAGSTKRSIPSPDKGQREGKAPMIIEETPKKSREQILQEEASLVEAIRLDTLQKEEVAKQVHLVSLLAQRIAEEELNEQQKKRRAQVQFEAQHYTDEDCDLIREKIEANAEFSKSMLGSDLQGEDFAKKMVPLIKPLHTSLPYPTSFSLSKSLLFGDPAFQRVSDIHKVETTTLLGYKLLAYPDKSTANQKFVKLMGEMISMRPDKQTLQTKKANLELMGFKED
ncbi:hypothetical protein Tco_0212629 [Tanacetum coccineum]